MDENTTYNDSKSSILNLTGQGPSSGVSPLEQEVLDEYERLSQNMKEVSKPSVLSSVRFRSRNRQAKRIGVGWRREKVDITS
jgi:hypothetical protein